ncbi:MAG: flagellar protein FlhE [Candidatus Accumulibacter sp.]|nr:flagellar protein FlhE [Accumulibacter sp.]
MWYTTNFPIVGDVPPANAKVSNVPYYYTVGTIPSGGTFTAYLCQGNTNTCFNVTNARSGTISAFSGYPANVPFFLMYRIDRSSSFAAVNGGNAQVIVNWSE